MASPVSDVFVSYKSEDRARVKPLIAALEAEGFSVWWDARIGGGADWRQDIQDHLDAARCVIVAWTRQSVGREGHFVRDEAARAQRLGTYLPVCMDAVDPPLGFGQTHALSLRGWKAGRSDAKFRAVADAVRSRVAGEAAERRPGDSERPMSRRSVLVKGAAVAAVAAAVAAGGWFAFRPSPGSSRRIAVMPFANLSSDPEQAYFSEGVAEELRAALSRVGLEVIGRASSEAVKDLDTTAAAAKLGVANIVTGSVRRSPGTIRVNAQLLSGSDGVERWTQSYDRAPGDTIKIQSDIAANVAHALSIALGQAGRAVLTLGGTANIAAQDFYLRGVELRRNTDNEAGVRGALALFDAAIAQDPDYASAHVLRALMLDVLGSRFPRSPADIAATQAQALAAANRAIHLAPSLGYAHAVLGLIEFDRLNFANALRQAREALALSPDEPRVIRAAANIVPFLGDGKEALRLADRLIAIDPLEARTSGARAQIFYLLRRYRQSIEAARKALALAPQNSNSRQFTGASLTLLNQPAAAASEYRQMPTDDPLRLAGEAILAARSHDRAQVERLIAHMNSLFGAAASYQCAQAYAQAGDANRAFAELGRAVRAREPALVQLKVDPFLDPIRRDARYASLVEGLKFPG